ncbi:hypothetical protein CEXT_633561 [Caerostris extrusa]|uniref:Uncharacterized protein n=1 Tax=Caerostris extrusa TaxID=172846 RepID=A0AAV4PED6_CAEEX|nr:hypothetical protein CEXT_633561 [Caerostris extrusa]
MLVEFHAFTRNFFFIFTLHRLELKSALYNKCLSEDYLLTLSSFEPDKGNGGTVSQSRKRSRIENRMNLIPEVLRNGFTHRFPGHSSSNTP